MNYKYIFRFLLGIASILFLVFLAMQFTSELDWGFGDFLVAGVLFFSFGLAYLFLRGKGSSLKRKVVVGVVVLGVLVIVWMELAVGLFGTPLAGS